MQQKMVSNGTTNQLGIAQETQPSTQNIQYFSPNHQNQEVWQPTYHQPTPQLQESQPSQESNIKKLLKQIVENQENDRARLENIENQWAQTTQIYYIPQTVPIQPQPTPMVPVN